LNSAAVTRRLQALIRRSPGPLWKAGCAMGRITHSGSARVRCGCWRSKSKV